MGFKDLVGKKMTKKVRFMNEDVTIAKLSVSEVMAIQEAASNMGENDSKGFDILKTVIRSSVEGADSLEDKDFETFPMDELSNLSNEIMKFSGISDNKAGK